MAGTSPAMTAELKGRDPTSTVTPAKAGVHAEIAAIGARPLDSGLRRNDDRGCCAARAMTIGQKENGGR
jgi:hypothetical protein